MQKPNELKKRVSDNPSCENNTKKISTETSTQSSKNATSNEGNCFSNFFQKLACSRNNFADDESEVVIIPKPK
jgi:hypothetical protein